MNVLFILPYCYIKEKKIGWDTGFGIYTVQLAEELAKREDLHIYVLSLRQRFQRDFTINNVTYIGFKDAEIVHSFVKGRHSIQQTRKIVKNTYYRQDLLRKTLIAAYVVGRTNTLAAIIEKYSIDFVHIHSLAQEMAGVFESESIRKDNTLVTVHSTFIKEEKYGNYIHYFRDSAKSLLERGYHMSFISSGVKEQFINELGELDTSKERMHVVLNGTVFTDTKIQRKKSKKKLFVCVGTVCDRKNQMQLLDALRLLNSSDLSNILIYVLGRDATEGKFEERIKQYGLEQCVQCIGFVSPESMKTYYSEASGNILLSKEEAFGLSIIEGFQYGIPTLCFNDISAAVDIYNPEAVQLVEDRSNESLARSISVFMNKEWNTEVIKQWAQRYSLDYVTDQYFNLYKAIKDK